MIRQGSEGSLSLFYKGLLISSFPLTKNTTVDFYAYQGEYLILQSIRQNIKIPFQIQTYISFCNSIYSRKKNGDAIYKEDHKLFVHTLFALLKLKIIQDDDNNGILVMPRR